MYDSRILVNGVFSAVFKMLSNRVSIIDYTMTIWPC